MNNFFYHEQQKSKKQWLVGLLFVSVFLLVLTTHSVKAATVTSKEITSIEEPKWITKAGMSKGINHDRQDLGFVLQANNTIQVRQTNKQFEGTLKLRLLGNDSKVEKTINVGSEWVTLSGTEDLVPFIDTPFGTTKAVIEYKLSDEAKKTVLPIVDASANEKDFFKTWDSANSAFALIKGKDFQLLVPQLDKEAVRSLKDFDNLSALIAYYEAVFAFDNKLAGFDNSTPTNKNGANRYFLKADKNGAGGAYYSSSWTANSKASISMWLEKNNWGSLHEIAHGYQAGFDGKGMYTGEVSNNLFGVQYQYAHSGKEADKSGWLFNYGKKEQVDNQLYKDLIEQKGGYAATDLRGKLVLLTMLKQRAGDEAFTKMYQGYRAQANEAGFNNEQTALPDLLNHYYSEHSHLDFTAALTNLGLSVNDDQASINRMKGFEAVASLVDVVPKQQLSVARELVDPKLLITSNFEMVKNSDIAALGLTGNLNLTFTGDNIAQLIGMKVRVKDGAKIVQEKRLEKDTVTFENLPNGVYSIELPDSKMTNYTMAQNYVYVKETQNSANIALQPINRSDLNNQTITFKGLSSKVFGNFQTDANTNSAIFTITNTTPHAYFKDERYVGIKVTRSDGKSVYEKTINGTNAPLLADKIPLVVGDTVEIYHAETSNRLTAAEPIIATANNTNRWTVTKYGLKNEALQNNPEADLITRINTRAEAIRGNESLKDVPLERSSAKKQLLKAIKSLAEPQQTQLLNEYADLFPLPKAEQGELFEYTFKGLGNNRFATMNLRLDEGRAEIKTVAKKPHSYFDEPYAFISIKNSAGEVTYEKEYIGNVSYQAKTDEVKLSVGDYVSVYHAEAKHENRLVIQNSTTQQSLATAKEITYQVEKTGLKQIVEPK